MIQAHYFAHPIIHTENIAVFPLGHEFPWVLELSGAKILACNKMLTKNIMRDEFDYQLLQHIKSNTVNILFFLQFFWIPDISLKYKSCLHSVTSYTIDIYIYSIYHIPYNVPFLSLIVQGLLLSFFSFHISHKNPPPPPKKKMDMYMGRGRCFMSRRMLCFV